MTLLVESLRMEWIDRAAMIREPRSDPSAEDPPQKGTERPTFGC